MRPLSSFPQVIPILTALTLVVPTNAQVATDKSPRLAERDGRHALLVDGAPFLVLGAQIGNSSAWPSLLEEKVWPALESMHVNTAEAPVYWEQIEPQPGNFDWTNVDALLSGAREHNLHLILLWFGTWKNGNDHYVPQWVKTHPEKFPRMENSAGAPIDDLSANAPANMEADRAAFAALMRHLAEKDSSEHTVLMMQVENESGGIGAVRDFSAESNREFAGQVPAELVRALGKQPGTWSEVFPGTADESFQAWHQARYVNAIAEAGKREFNIPFYCNVWLAYPPAELPERRIATAGIGYPSGGPNQLMLPIWKFAAPSIDLIGPDLYSSDPSFYLNTLDTYARPDNPLWVPETGQGDVYAPYFFSALGRGAIGFSPFGVDWTGWLPKSTVPKAHAANYALVGSMDRTLAKLNFAGKLKTMTEVAGGASQQVIFFADPALHASGGVDDALINASLLANAMVAPAQVGNAATRVADQAGAWIAEARFGFPQRDGEGAPGSADKSGRVLVAQMGPNEFLLAGIGAAVFFHRPGYLPGIRMQILSAEEGYFTPASMPGAPEEWHRIRILNGDETDRGIRFPDPHAIPIGLDAAQPAGGDPASPSPRQHAPVSVRVLLDRF